MELLLHSLTPKAPLISWAAEEAPVRCGLQQDVTVPEHPPPQPAMSLLKLAAGA